MSSSVVSQQLWAVCGGIVMAPSPAIPAAAAAVVGNEAGFAVNVATAVQFDYAADLLFAAHANSAVSHITTSKRFFEQSRVQGRL